MDRISRRHGHVFAHGGCVADHRNGKVVHACGQSGQAEVAIRVGYRTKPGAQEGEVGPGERLCGLSVRYPACQGAGLCCVQA